MFNKPEHREALKQILFVAAKRHNIELVESDIIEKTKGFLKQETLVSYLPDHVHLVIRIKSTMSQSEAVGLLKGASAYGMFRKHPNYRLRYPKGHLWSCGNFKDSVGRVQQGVIEIYVLEDNNLSGNPAL